MKRFNLTSFPILVILLLCLCFLRISRTSCISEGHGEKRVAVHEENSSSLPVAKDKSQVETAKSSGTMPNDSEAMALYPDSIWGKFREENPSRFHEILNDFETKGALAPISLLVCDEDGNPVPEAKVRFSFSTSEGLDHDKRVFGITDETGRFSAEERSIWAVGWRVEKDGYYSNYSNFTLQSYATVQGWKDRRWFRRHFHAKALLRKKSPHEMAYHDIELSLPPAGEKIGFDLVEGKPTPPYGVGRVSDIVLFQESQVKWEPRSTEDRFSSVHIVLPGEGNGVVRFSMDETSDLKSPRLAPETGYNSAIESVSQVLNGRYTEKDLISPKEYLVVKIRSSLSVDGIVTNAIYGKIRGYWHVNGPKRLISFRTWMNKEAGNRNLEDASGWW